MKNVFIETSRVLAFREAIGIVSDNIKGQPGFMVVWGYAGRGKTRCAKEYCTINGNTAYVRVFEGWTPRAMLAKICYELNGMEPGRIDRAKSVIMEELDRKKDLVLVVDEADRLSTSNIEHLRDIHDEMGNPIVLIGEPSLYGRLTARRRIWERVTRVVEFGPVKTEDVALFGLKACDLRIKPEASAELVRRCKGSFRLLYHLMVDLERQARANKINTVNLDVIEALPERRIAPTPEKEKR